MPWYVYLVRGSTGALYTGATKNVAKRIRDHNAGRGSKWCYAHRPVHLAWLSHPFTKQEALRLEYAIKQLKASDKQRLATGPVGQAYLGPEGAVVLSD